MEFSIRGIGIIKEADIKMDGLTVIAGSNTSGKTTVGRALYSVVSAAENLEEEQETDKSVAVIYRIRRVLRPFNEWLNICESLLENEENGFLNDILKIRYAPVNGERLDYYVDLLFRLCDSMENGSFIGMLVDVVGSIESSAKAKILNDWGDNREKILNECRNSREFVESLHRQTKKEFAYKMIERTLKIEFADQVQSFITLDENEESVLRFDDAEKNFYDIHLYENEILMKKSNFVEGYYDRAYFVDDPYIIEDQVAPSFVRYHISGNYMQSRILSHREKMRRVMRNMEPDRGISETIYQEKELKEVMDRINSIVPGKISKGVYQTSTGVKLKVGNLATGSKVFSIIKKILVSGDITEKTLLILDEPESHLHPSWINQLAEVIVLLVKECNITVLLTTHSPNFLLAVDALMRKYDIREKCNFYQTELNDDNSIKYVEKTDCLDNIYSDFAESFAEMNALRKKHMILEE